MFVSVVSTSPSSVDGIGSEASEEVINTSPSSVTVLTDKPTYLVDESVGVTGSVGNVVEGEEVRLDVYDPDGKPFPSFFPIRLNDDDIFSTEISLSTQSGTRDILSGQYRILVTYGGQTAESTFGVTEAEPASATGQPASVTGPQ